MCSTIPLALTFIFWRHVLHFVCVYPLTIYHDIDGFTTFNFPIRFVSSWSTTFTWSLPLPDFSLCNFHISSCGLFFPIYLSPINLSCKAGLVVLNAFSFCLSVKLYLFQINESLAGLNILGSGFCSFITLNVLCHSLLACKISAEKSADCLMGVPLYTTSCFSLAACNSLSKFWHFSYNMSWYGLLWASQMALVVKNLPTNSGDVRDSVWALGQEDPLEEGMATHSSILAWRIPWTEEPGGPQSIGLKGVRHDWATDTHTHRDFFGIHFIWDFLCFLDLDVCFISEVRKVVSQLFLQISCLSFILALFLLKPYNVDVSMLDVVSEVS